MQCNEIENGRSVRARLIELRGAARVNIVVRCELTGCKCTLNEMHFIKLFGEMFKML